MEIDKRNSWIFYRSGKKKTIESKLFLYHQHEEGLVLLAITEYNQPKENGFALLTPTIEFYRII